MNDLYQEIMVSRKQTSADTMKKVLLIVATAILAAAGILITPIALLAAIVVGILSFYLISGLNVEYEYQYVNGDIDIDKIMNKSRRKKVASYAANELEIAAPSNSHELDSFRNNNSIQIKDYTSGEGKPAWSLVYNTEKGRVLATMELNDVIMQDLRRIAPRKIKFN